MGGVGPVPWTEIEEDIRAGKETWVLKSRLPDPEKAPLKDPAKLKLAQCQVWLKHMSKRQNGDPPEELFQFVQVYGGTQPPPEWSSALKPFNQVQRGPNLVHLLRYDGKYQTKSQAVKAIPYHKNSWIWYAHEKGHAIPLSHWLGLPSRAETESAPGPLIGEEEQGVIEDTFSTAYEEVQEPIEKLVDAVNKAETLGPASVSAVSGIDALANLIM